jgi:hypothetical protein
MATVPCDPAKLVKAAKCFSCVPREMRESVFLYLLCQIATLGAPGAGQMVLYTTTDPTTDGVFPPNLNGPAIAYRADGNGAIAVWDPVGHAWH